MVLENSTAAKQAKGAERILEETSVGCDGDPCVGGESSGEAGRDQWKREVILNVHQCLCFSPVA